MSSEMIPGTHSTRESYQRVSNAMDSLVELAARGRQGVEGEEPEVSNWGTYCRSANVTALFNVKNVCSGKISVKGDGIKPEGDEYGKPYIRVCEQLKTCTIREKLA